MTKIMYSFALYIYIYIAYKIKQRVGAGFFRMPAIDGLWCK